MHDPISLDWLGPTQQDGAVQYRRNAGTGVRGSSRSHQPQIVSEQPPRHARMPGAGGRKVNEKMSDLWHHYQSGGWAMWLILFWLICSIAVIAERSVFLFG